MSTEIVASISERYIELYEQITGDQFLRNDNTEVTERIEKNILRFLSTLN
jgi:phosphoribosylaminoimidazole-succinocarboxamide synthase